MRSLLRLTALSAIAVLWFAGAASAQQMYYPQGQMQAPAPSAPATGQYMQQAPTPSAPAATDQSMQAPAAPAATGQSVTVSMEDNYFDQANITVAPGTTVTWVQNGNNPHTTTSYDGLWDSGLIAGGSGGTFSFTFSEPGTYAYYCRPHESQGMVGTVTVTGGGTQQGAGAGGQQLAPTGGPPLVVLPVALFLLVSGALIAVLRRVL